MSVIADFQVTGFSPSVVGGTGTSAKYFPRLLGSSIGVQSVAPSSSSAAGQLVVPGNSSLNGQFFDVLVAGSFGSDTGDPSGTVKVELVANTGTVTSPSYTVLANSGTLTPTVAGGEDFSLKATLFGSTKSGVVQGYYIPYSTNNVGSNPTVTKLDNTLSSINFGASVPFGLAVRVTFGTSDATNTASLYQFQIVGA